MKFPEPLFFDHDNFKLAYYDSGPKDGYPLVLIHGWPEIAYSWAPIIPLLNQAGYRTIAMDVRGFGHSASPRGDSHYAIAQLVGDIEALLTHLGLPYACLIGHDWGGIIVWHAARMITERAPLIISLSTPHVGRAPVNPIDIFRKRHGDSHYFCVFEDNPDTANTIFSQDQEAFFRFMFRTTPVEAKLSSEMYYIPERFDAHIKAGAPTLPGQILTDADVAVYAQAYKRSGFHGGINLYRNTRANWELADSLSETITQPTLMISARQDLFLPPEMTEPMIATVPHLTRYTLENCGHWVMWEQPEQASQLILDWLSHHT